MKKLTQKASRRLTDPQKSHTSAIKESREWNCKGFLGYKTMLIAGLLFLASCSSTYRFTQYERSEEDSTKIVKVRVWDNSPRKYGVVIAAGFGLGEQFKKPNR